MRSPFLAIALEIVRQSRWTFRLVGAAPVVCGLLYWLLADLLRASELLRGLSLLPMILSLLGVFIGFNYTESSPRTGPAGFPPRLITLPVRTRLLVTCPVLCGVAAVTLLYLAWAALVLPALGIVLPVVRPALFLATGMVCYQAVIWGLAGFRLARLVVMGLLGTALLGAAIIVSLPEVAESSPWPVNALLALGLAPVGLIAYAGALVCVERQRRGGGRGRGWWRAGARVLLDTLPRRRRPFASSGQALCWFEWRRGGVVLPACVAFVLVFFVVPILWLGGGSPEVTFGTLCWAAALPPLLAAVVGLGVGKADFWARGLSLPTFLAVRPVRSGELVAAKLRVAAWSTLAAWALVAAVVPVSLALGCDTTLAAKFGAALLQQYDPLALAALVPLGLLSAPILTWRLLVSSLHVGLSGRARLLLSSAGLAAAGVLAVVVVLSWLLSRPDPSKAMDEIAGWLKGAFESIPGLAWVLSTAFTLKLAGAVWSWDAARRRDLLSARAVGAYLAVWSAATACCAALAWLLCSPGEGDGFAFPFDLLIRAAWLPYLLLLACLLLVPLARVGLAPLSLASNRHGLRRTGPASTRMSWWLLPPVVALGCLAALLPWQVAEGYGKRVDAGGHRVRMRVVGEGSPAVVLESFGVAPLEAWAKVQPGVAAFTRVVAYDHAGYWGSQDGPRPRDARRIAGELRAALHDAGVEPPYVLVGYSFGGPYVRVYAAAHPEEVAGLVLVDPTQEEAMGWLRERYPWVNRISPQERAARTEFGCAWDSLDQARAAWPLPDVPVTLITCMRGNGTRLAAEFLPVWLESHRRWLRGVPHAKHVIAEGSSHGIILEEPAVVTAAIRQVVEQARDRRR